MQKVKVIIGASYGDEGKGLATDYFAAAAVKARAGDGSLRGGETGDGRTLTVLTNGGPQRGHTVELPDGRRHVFKHFGSASFRGAVTWIAPTFLLNPMQLVKEYAELTELDREPVVLIDPRCRFTTPYDVLMNQMLQEHKARLTGKEVFNSCGFGIWETVLRYQRGMGTTFGSLLALDTQERIAHLRQIRDGYFRKRILECGMQKEEVWEIFYDEGILRHYLEDCETVRLLCPQVEESCLRQFGTVLFENAQGLLLDGNRKGEEEITTPSTTGAAKVHSMIERNLWDADVEVCYVTRSYLTRHGEGPLEGEIADPADGILSDRTNIANHFQGALRYGIMKDTGTLADRALRDFEVCRENGTGNRYRASVMVTHLNEHRGIDLDQLRDRFDTVYVSDGRTEREVEQT